MLIEQQWKHHSEALRITLSLVLYIRCFICHHITHRKVPKLFEVKNEKNKDLFQEPTKTFHRQCNDLKDNQLREFIKFFFLEPTEIIEISAFTYSKFLTTFWSSPQVTLQTFLWKAVHSNKLLERVWRYLWSTHDIFLEMKWSACRIIVTDLWGYKIEKMFFWGGGGNVKKVSTKYTKTKA